MSSRSDPARVTPELLRSWGLPAPGESKNARGRAFVVGGSPVSAGAVTLAGESALRVGAGKVGVAVDADIADVVRVAFPEAGVYVLPGDGADAAWHAELDAADVVLVGPGFDSPGVTHARLAEIVAHEPSCLVVDAFAVGVLDRVDRAQLPASLIVNANLDEAEILLGRPVGDPLRDVPEIARELGAVVHCYSAVAAPTGEAWDIGAGGPGLGTAGSGDVLAGAITGFAARGLDPVRAAVWGAWCHAQAGDRLTARHGLGFLARELPPEVAAVLHDFDAPPRPTLTGR